MAKYLKITLLLAAFILFDKQLFAQQDVYKWRVGTGVGNIHIGGELQGSGDQTSGNDIASFDPNFLAWSLSVEYLASESIGIGLFGLSETSGSDLKDAGLYFRYYTDNPYLLGRRTFISPFFNLGITSDKQADKFAIPLGAGLKFRLWHRMNVNLSYTAMLYSDQWDNIAESFKSNYVSYTSVSVHYNFSERKQHFKAPKIYSSSAYLSDKFEYSTNEQVQADSILQYVVVQDVSQPENVDSVEINFTASPTWEADSSFNPSDTPALGFNLKYKTSGDTDTLAYNNNEIGMPVAESVYNWNEPGLQNDVDNATETPNSSYNPVYNNNGPATTQYSSAPSTAPAGSISSQSYLPNPVGLDNNSNSPVFGFGLSLGLNPFGKKSSAKTNPQAVSESLPADTIAQKNTSIEESLYVSDSLTQQKTDPEDSFSVSDNLAASNLTYNLTADSLNNNEAKTLQDSLILMITQLHERLSKLEMLNDSVQSPNSPKETEVHKAEVFFNVNSTSLSELAINALSEILIISKDAGKYKIDITGYADRTGNPEHNLHLSKLRAISVKDYLVQNGIKEEHVKVHYKGADLSLNPNEQAYGRRVEIVIK